VIGSSGGEQLTLLDPYRTHPIHHVGSPAQ
jgi:hypothetical protein